MTPYQPPLQKPDQRPKIDQEMTQAVHATQQACRKAAIDAWEDAQIRGLCAEGAFEVAMEAIDQVSPNDIKPYLFTLPSKEEPMNPYIELFERGSLHLEDQASSLLKVIKPEQMTKQIGGVVNHPAWTISHLIHYHPALLSLAKGQPIADPGNQPNADIYDAGSTPKDDPKLYKTKDQLIHDYTQGHRQLREALQKAPLEYFTQPPQLDRWAKLFKTTADALVYLMLLHESQHLGEVMVWRRAMNIPLPE